MLLRRLKQCTQSHIAEHTRSGNISSTGCNRRDFYKSLFKRFFHTDNKCLKIGRVVEIIELGRILVAERGKR